MLSISNKSMKKILYHTFLSICFDISSEIIPQSYNTEACGLSPPLPSSILQQRNQLFSRGFPPSFLSFVLK